MLETILTTDTFTSAELLLSFAVSIALGALLALGYMYKNAYGKGFVVTLVLLPAMVQMVIMLVNGNLGTGVAVMGAFSLVRFRSVPGSAREIAAIFAAMVVGLATGTGYLLAAAAFAVLITLVNLTLMKTKFGETKDESELNITIPENLDYTELFDDLMEIYTTKYALARVKTTNMGSLYELTYRINLKDERKAKEFLDQLRVRNGNLNISLGRAVIKEGL